MSFDKEQWQLNQPRVHYLRMKFELYQIFLNDPTELLDLLGRTNGQLSELRLIWQLAGDLLPIDQQLDAEEMTILYAQDVGVMESLIITFPDAKRVEEMRFFGIFRKPTANKSYCFTLQKTAETAADKLWKLIEVKATGQVIHSFFPEIEGNEFTSQCLNALADTSDHPISFSKLPMAELVAANLASASVLTPAQTTDLLTQHQQNRQKKSKRPKGDGELQDSMNIQALIEAKRLMVWGLVAIVSLIPLNVLVQIAAVPASLHSFELAIPYIVGLSLLLGLIGLVGVCRSLKTSAWVYVVVVLIWCIPILNLLLLMVVNRKAQIALQEQGHFLGAFDIW